MLYFSAGFLDINFKFTPQNGAGGWIFWWGFKNNPNSFTLLDLQNTPGVEAQLVGGRKFSFQWIKMDEWFGFQLPKAGKKMG